MENNLKMQLADDSQRMQAFENVHEFWHGGRSLEEHLAWRLQSPQHLWANWYVGCLDGRVVTSLGAYPLQMRVGDDVCDGIAVGAVHTVPEYRGRGLAPQLLTWVEDQQWSQGVRFSVLFSDISPDFYARLGYQLCPSWRGNWRESTEVAIPNGTYRGFYLQDFQPCEHRSALDACYRSWQSGLPASIERSPEYWNYLIGKAREDRFVWLLDASGRQRGYAVLASGTQTSLLREVVVDQHDAELTGILLQLVADALAQQQLAPLQAWVPSIQPFVDLFDMSQRTVEITMLKWNAAGGLMPSAEREGLQWLQELDHV